MKRLLATTVIASLVFAVAACGKSGSGDPPSASDGKSSVSSGPLDRYDPPITIKTVRSTDSTVKFKDGESFTNNAWYNSYKSDLGIQLEYDWVVNGDQYESKMNVTITSGQLPDIFTVNATQLKQLVAAGKLEDLTPYYSKYSSDLTKRMIESGKSAKKAATFDGKLMGLPPSEDLVGGLGMLWIRKDWLDKLSLQPPQSMDDVLRISDAFTNQDPDGNNQKDTFGLAATKDLWGGASDLTGFMNGYHAYPKVWIKNASGSLVYGSVQPEMKTALAKLQEMFKNGQIDREFGAKDGGKESDLTTAGKIGMAYGQQWNSIWPLQASFDKDPKADWTPYPLVSINSDEAQPQANVSFNSFVVVRKGAKHPEAAIKMQNLAAEHWFGNMQDSKKFHSADGIEFFKYMAFMQGTGPVDNVDHYLKVKEALDTKDEKILNSEQKNYYDKIKEFQQANAGPGWGYEKIFYAGSQAILKQYKDGGLHYKKNEFFGAPTPTMVSKKSSLDKMELETFTQIILGASLDKFDEFVSNWNKLGGDKMTEEVNQWFKSVQ